MGLGLIPIFSVDPAPEFDSLGETLAAELVTLEQIASGANLRPLGSFADQRQIPEDFDGDPDELERLLGPCTDWFEPEAGVQAVDRLIALIESSPEPATALEHRDAILQELTALRACLRAAIATDVKFRLTLA